MATASRQFAPFRLAVLCVLLPFLAGCRNEGSPGSVPASSPIGKDSSPQDLDSNEKRTEVVVVATRHFITDMPEGYTPGHLRALLEKISPDALAVEAPTNVSDPWSLAPFELWNVTQPWAAQTGIEIAPSGWHEPQYQMQLGQMFQQYQAEGRTVQYQQIERAFQAKSAAQPLACQFMNSAAYHDLWRDYHTGLHELLGADTPWEKWNARILANVRQTCREHAGQRVAVVFGGAHGYYLLDHLSNDPCVKLVPTQQFLPLTEDEIASHTQPVDYLKALRPLNLSVVSAAQLAHATSLLHKVKEVPQFAGDYLLFHGKYLLHEGRAEEALSEFEKLAEYSRDIISEFDGKSRLAEAALVYSARTLNQMGNPAKARKRLADVVNDSDVSLSTRQWAQQVLAGIPGK